MLSPCFFQQDRPNFLSSEYPEVDEGFLVGGELIIDDNGMMASVAVIIQDIVALLVDILCLYDLWQPLLFEFLLAEEIEDGG